jgi:hypothetical protein
MLQQKKNSLPVTACMCAVILLFGLSCSPPAGNNISETLIPAQSPLNTVEHGPLYTVDHEVSPTFYRFGTHMNGFKVMADHNWQAIDDFGTLILNDQNAIVIADMQTTNGSDPCEIRFDNDYSNGTVREFLTMKIEEETSNDTETTHTYAEAVGGIVAEPGTIYDVNGKIVGYALHVDDVEQYDGEIYSFAGAAGFDDPILFANIRTYDGYQPCHVRITGKERMGQGWVFYFFIEEWNYLDGNHNGERVDFLILERGIHRIRTSSDGRTPYFLEVGTYTPENSVLEWKNIQLCTDFSTSPIVITQSQTYVGDNQIVTRNINIEPENDTFQVRMYEEEARYAGGDNAHFAEEIGYLAIGPGRRLFQVDDPEYVSLITGYHEDNVNRQSCELYDVWGTDLGIPFYHPEQDRIFYVFGDTLTDRGYEQRSPVMSWSYMLSSSLDSVQSGIFESWISQNVKAVALWGTEWLPTDIPTTAWSMDGIMYIWSMRVDEWGIPGEWTCEYSRLMYSTGDGFPGTWNVASPAAERDERKSMGSVWPGEPDYVYFYVNYPGRTGKDPSGTHPVYLMRVRKDTFPEFNMNTEGQYLNGTYPNVEWVMGSHNWDHPTVVIPGNIGELSIKKFVLIDDHYLAMYFDYTDPGNPKLQIAQSEDVIGPWVVCGTVNLSSITDNPYGSGFINPYGGFMIGQISVQNTGSVDVYFTLSEWGDPVPNSVGSRYNVHLLKVLVHE